MTGALDAVAGPAFPFRIDASGGVAWTAGPDKVREDVRALLATRRGERPMLRDYGTRLAALVQEPLDDVLADLAGEEVRTALLRFEPRIVVTRTDVVRGPDDGTLEVDIGYVHVHESVAGRTRVPLR